jgi:hypothetical protein
MSTNDGGPAFPVVTAIRTGRDQWGNPQFAETEYTESMSMRDYFAAKAMQGLLSNPRLRDEILDHGGAFGGWIETSAYGWADAMLKAREVKA